MLVSTPGNADERPRRRAGVVGQGAGAVLSAARGGTGWNDCAVAAVDFEARATARKAAAMESRRCLELAVVGGSPTPLADPVAGCAARCDATPAGLAAVMGGRAGTSYLPLPAGPVLGSAARCGVVPQPAEPAAETGGAAGIGYLDDQTVQMY